jgi:hypothetical protein
MRAEAAGGLGARPNFNQVRRARRKHRGHHACRVIVHISLAGKTYARKRKAQSHMQKKQFHTETSSLTLCRSFSVMLKPLGKRFVKNTIFKISII